MMFASIQSNTSSLALSSWETMDFIFFARRREVIPTMKKMTKTTTMIKDENLLNKLMYSNKFSAKRPSPKRPNTIKEIPQNINTVNMTYY